MVPASKREAYAELQANLAKLQEVSQEFAQHLGTVRGVCEASEALASGSMARPFTHKTGEKARRVVDG